MTCSASMQVSWFLITRQQHGSRPGIAWIKSSRCAKSMAMFARTAKMRAQESQNFEDPKVFGLFADITLSSEAPGDSKYPWQKSKLNRADN